MKKLFTLVALLAMFLGANAQGGKWSTEPVYSIDYSTYNAFPFYVMAYAPTFDGTGLVDAPTTKKLWRGNENDFPGEDACEGTVTVNGNEFYVQETGENQWRQYFVADGIQTKIDGKYKVVAKVKASAPVNIDVNMGWGWGSGQQIKATVAIPDGADFQEVTWEYSGIGGTSCNLVAQPGTSAETIEWLSVKVYEWQKEGGRVPVWLEDIENGDAETAWTADQAVTLFNDMENNFKICAWAKEKGHNMNADDGWDPFPATIEDDPDKPGNHVFVVHGQAATTSGDASAWDNQFWIQSKHSWPAGTSLKIHFRYKCSKSSVTTQTQTHKQTPSDYLIWHAIGDITFTDEWQTFDGTMSIAEDMANGWSIAFNLNANDKDAIDFYFDDLSWKYLELDEGYFISGINTNTTTEYNNLDNAVQFEGDETTLEATFGTAGDESSYVNQIMISTRRGDDQAFKGATLKPAGKVKNDPDDWQEFAASTNYKIDLPGLGVWKVYLDLEYNSIAFQMLEGTPDEEPDPIAIITNPAVITVNATEREYTTAEAEAAGVEAPAAPGAPWDNQFFIKANRILKEGEVTVVEFDYVATKDAKVTTQGHALPGNYRGGGCGEVNFTTTEAHFKGEFKVPAHQSNDIQSIAFNLSEIKDANDYTFKNFQWYLKDESLAEGMTYENLIDETGTENNFSWKVLTGIFDVINDATTRTDVIYNLSGQRVSKDYKGVVIMNGRKVVNK